MKNISATSLSVYNTCPYQWKLKYIDRLLQLPNPAFIIGTEYHLALKRFHKGLSKEAIINSIKESLMPNKTDEEIDRFALVRKMFELYCKYPVPGDIVSNEQEFKLEIPDLPMFYGFIDRIDTDKVVEYKTSSKDYTEEDIKSVQTDFYSFVRWMITGKIPQVVYSVMNKKKVNRPGYKPQILSITRTKEDLTNLKMKCVNFCNNVADKKFKPKIGFYCRWCPYGKSGTNNCNYAK